MSKERGFIALMSAIIISAILLILATSGSLTGLYERSNVLDAELKDRSAAAADACADQAFLQIGSSIAYQGAGNVGLNALDACQFIVSGSPLKIISVQATSSSAAVTDLQIVYDPNSASVISWKEVPLF